MSNPPLSKESRESNWARKWVIGARPRTLPAAVIPVVVGTALAAHEVEVIWWRAAAALVVALALQIGTNYANDYADGVRGTDAVRVGPVRLVASGLASPPAVRRAALGAFSIAALVGLALSLIVNPLLLVVGAACVLAGWFYTGGKRPYGYRGLGELSVFVFFGIVAVCGSQYVQQERVDGVGLAAGVAVGLLAVSLLVVNNLRDRANDETAGKQTLAVRLGDAKTRQFYVACVVLPFVVAMLLSFSRAFTPVVALALPLAAAVVKPVLRGASGRDLIAVLQETGRLQLAFGGLFAIGLYI